MSRTEGADRPVDASLVASWHAAEADLFTLVLSSPALYEDVVTALGATVDDLRALGSSSADLLEASGTAEALARERLAATATARFLKPDLVARAALAVRHREMVAEQASARRHALLTAARNEGRTWAVLEERGAPAGDVYAPYRRLEAHSGTGDAVLVTAGPDEEFRTCEHRVEVLRVELETGRLDEPPAPVPTPFACRSGAEREAWVDAWRAALNSPD